MHPSIQPYLEYFSLPKGYGPSGLRWSATGEAIETDDGTFRFTRQIADFVEGFASVKAIVHFAHVLECLQLLGVNPPNASPTPERFKLLAASFRQLGAPARNAGALFGQLCFDIPPAAHVPPGGGKSLAHWLTHSPSLGFLHPVGPGNPEVPALAVHAFHNRVAFRLQAMTDFEVRHWLRNGIGPQDLPGDDIADRLDRKPLAMGEFLDIATEQRTRLGGALPLVRHFVSALSIPPRKYAPPQLPIGGYADIASRGDPAQILPSQLALDPDEFVRRFAEHELLFFRREDPHERRRDQLVLVVDQGVLTWGVVRLALSAAVLAFARYAAKREMQLAVRFSSSPTERLSLPFGDPKHFGNLLEASDLSATPANALSEELVGPDDQDRDVVLLTHPRTLHAEEIQQLSKTSPEGARLFALTANEDGKIELAHLRGGGSVSISQFHIDFNLATPEPSTSLSVAAPYVPWSGNVELVPYPFRFGLTNRLVDVTFDASGTQLMSASVGGFLHVWTLSDGAMEVIPRGANEGQVLKDVQAVLGVENGFVVCGRFGAGLVAVHYDMRSRMASMHTLFTEIDNLETAWYAFPNLGSVVVKAGPVYRAFDLGTGGRYPEPLPGLGLSNRAKAAFEAARLMLLPAPHTPVVKSDFSKSQSTPFVVHEPRTGVVHLISQRGRTSFAPTSDGRARLKGPVALSAQLAGSTLALTAHATFPSWSLYDVDHDGRSLAELSRPHGAKLAKLSLDGRFFVRQTNSCELTVSNCRDGSDLLTTIPGRCHSNLDVRLGYRCMGIGIGPRGVLLDWNVGPLVLHEGLSPSDDFGHRATNRVYRGHGLFAPTTGRFLWMYKLTRWEIGVDGFGQIAFVRDGVVACMLIYRRWKLAAWLPDGVRFGPADLTGGPETPNALEKLGNALREVTR